MELTSDHLQPENLDPTALFESGDATLWRIDTTHQSVVDADHVTARLATTTIWSLDADRTYALLVLRERYTWTDEAISELLRYMATQLHDPDADVTDTFSVEVFAATQVRSVAGRTVWYREDYIGDSSG